MAFDSDKEGTLWLTYQAGLIDQERYEAALAEARRPRAPRAAPTPRRAPQRRQSALVAFSRGWKAGKRRRSVR